jgi:hypothetical protein
MNDIRKSSLKNLTSFVNRYTDETKTDFFNYGKPVDGIG